jgi:hypothetical protein
VHADHLVGPFRAGRDFGDRYGACVRGENRRAASGRVEVGEDLELEVAVFGRGFDDKRRSIDCGERLLGDDTLENDFLAACSVPS